ncbi:MAG: helix-turn-helix domain-containing protein [Candidatus Brennerbacteria bacterium]|nr:helix-turn-helix domain-containing protein [Candidatus Brennerbacteria bacterium]
MKSEKILDSLVTPYERRNIVMRAAVMNLVNSGAGPRQISRELQISRQTISSIKKAVVKEISYKSYWERSKTERKKKVYSSDPSPFKKEPYRRYRRTKYGKVYLHY